MVLQDLGNKLSNALKHLNAASAVDEDAFKAVVQDICRALLEADVNVKIVCDLRKRIESKVDIREGQTVGTRRKLIQQAVSRELCSILDPKNPPPEMRRGKPNVIMFVGLQGAGKTTTVGKFAHFYQRKGWRVAMVCADTFRAGAFDQLKQNATRLRCPFYGSYTEVDAVSVANQGVAQFRRDKYDIILLDTSGRHRQEESLFEEMKEIDAVVQPDNIVFVMDATQGQALGEIAESFHKVVNVGCVIITKLDGHAKGGGALSAVAATGSPVLFLGSGERFDDFEQFHAKSFVSSLLGFSDIRGFFREAQEAQKDSNVANRIAKGKFTLRDFYIQLQTMMKMGPMDKIMSMLPGMASMDTSDPKSRVEQQKAIKSFMYMIDSMSDDELDGKVPDLINCEDRIRRIARGSGRMEEEVKFLLHNQKHFERMISKMGKSGMTKPGGMKLPGGLPGGNPKAMEAAMQQLQMQGGPGAQQNMLKMFQQMQGGGGSGSQQDMLKMFQQMSGKR
eukprot:336727_1